VRSYRDRAHAGDVLAEALHGYAGRPGLIVLGLVRGGVPVAARVAAALPAPLDVLVVRKLGVPWAPEVAFGALGPGGVRVINPEIADRVDAEDIDAVIRAEAAELDRREQRYRAGRSPLDLAGRTVIVVDDGLATGATAAAALAVTDLLGAAGTVLAAPVASTEALARLDADVVCPLVPADFGAVSRFYRRFEQVSDEQVIALLG
jgi:putative phosphoribosyl transferase